MSFSEEDLNKIKRVEERLDRKGSFYTEKDYYSIEWPVTTREWELGTYMHEVLEHYIPWINKTR